MVATVAIDTGIGHSFFVWSMSMSKDAQTVSGLGVSSTVHQIVARKGSVLVGVTAPPTVHLTAVETFTRQLLG